MANLKGLVSVVLQLREQRTNLINDLKHVDAALSVLKQSYVGLVGGQVTNSQIETRKDNARVDSELGQ